MNIIYNTALKSKNIEICVEEKSYFKGILLTAIKHDIIAGLPREFRQCEFIYSEPSWRNGYKKYQERANPERSEWREYLKSLCTMSGKPTYLIMGKEAERYIHDDTKGNYIKKQIVFNHVVGSFQAVLYILNTRVIPVIKTTIELMEYLFEVCDIGGDPCCGYGLLGRFAIKNNKKAILSDIDGKCIGYIAAKEAEWISEQLKTEV